MKPQLTPQQQEVYDRFAEVVDVLLRMPSDDVEAVESSLTARYVTHKHDFDVIEGMRWMLAELRRVEDWPYETYGRGRDDESIWDRTVHEAMWENKLKRSA